MRSITRNTTRMIALAAVVTTTGLIASACTLLPSSNPQEDKPSAIVFCEGEGAAEFSAALTTQQEAQAALDEAETKAEKKTAQKAFDKAEANVKATMCIDFSQELIDKLTTSTITAPCVENVDDDGTVPTVIGSLVGLEKTEEVPNPRIFSDSPTTPLLETADAEAARDEYQQDKLCPDGLLTVAAAAWIATVFNDYMLERTGFDIVAHTEWLQPYAVASDEVNELAAEFVPLLNKKIIAGDGLTEDEEALLVSAVVKNQDLQTLAGHVGTFLDNFVVRGFAAYPSIENFHLAAGGTAGDPLKEVELDNPTQESLNAVILSLTEKGRCGDLVTLGINALDGRLEIIEPLVCVTPPPPGETCEPNCDVVPPNCPDCKLHANDVTPVAPWTPLGPDPVTSSPAPLDPDDEGFVEAPESDVDDTWVPPVIVQDDDVDPPPEDPGTEITDPDA